MKIEFIDGIVFAFYFDIVSAFFLRRSMNLMNEGQFTKFTLWKASLNSSIDLMPVSTS